MSKIFIMILIIIFIFLNVNEGMERHNKQVGGKHKRWNLVKTSLKKVVSSLNCTSGGFTEYKMLEEFDEPNFGIEEESTSTSEIIKRKGKGKGKFISSPSTSPECKCKKYRIEELSNINITSNEGTNIELKYKADNSQDNIGKGGFGSIYHAYYAEIDECIALKVSSLIMGNDAIEFCKKMVNNEINILSYFSKNENNLNHSIIHMYGKKETTDNMFIALELGGQNLNAYFYQVMNINKHQRLNIAYRLVIDISICAAESLQQFLDHAFHLDIKSTNFILSSYVEAKVINMEISNNEIVEVNKKLQCKIIDFNTSVLHNNQNEIKWYSNGTRLFRAPEIREGGIEKEFTITAKADIWSFGLMMLGFIHDANKIYNNIQKQRNENVSIDYQKLDEILNTFRTDDSNNTPLDKLIKACINEEPNDRPDIDWVFNMLKKLKCDYESLKD